jgi:CRP/FNR family transcriptional regulator
MPEQVVIAGLETSARKVLARDARSARLKAGQTVFSPGQPCEAFLIVKTGSVRVSTVTETGRELLLYRVGPRQTCVLTTAALLASADYDVEGVAETDTEALAVPKALFEDLLARSAAFRHFVFSSYGDRLRDLIALVQDVSQRQVDRRLARFLIERGAKGPIAATHQEIAAELGTAREVISRLLKHFEAQGLVRLERRQIEIADRDKLALLHSRL